MRWKHRPYLDGLRAIAATLVIFFHAGSADWGGGFVGVDVFFVLSGFLITGVLMAGGDRFAMGSFYARRFRRLLPASLLTLLVTAGVWLTCVPPLRRADTGRDFLASALYSSNWVFLLDARDYFRHELDPSPVLHFWSLAVEEQYYLVWPWLLMGILAVARKPLGRLLLTVTLTAAATAWAVYVGYGDSVRAHFGTDARAYQLLLGVVVAMALPWLQQEREKISPLISACGALSLAAVVFLSTSAVDLAPARRGMLAALSTAGFLACAEITTEFPGIKLLRHRWMRLFGKVSYPAYLWHWPLVLLGDMVGLIPDHGFNRIAVIWSATQLLAIATWRWVERPAMAFELKSLAHIRMGVVGGLASSVVVGLTCFGLLQSDAVRPQDLGLRLEVEGEAGRLHEFGSEGPRVLLAGDSHAAHWWPAVKGMAERNGWQASLYWARSCGWPEQHEPTCEARDLGLCRKLLRQRLKETVDKGDYDLVLLASFTTVNCPMQGDSAPVPPGDPRHPQLVAEASMRTLSTLHDAGPDVVLIEPIPDLADSPLHCLDVDLDDSHCPKEAVSSPAALGVEHAWRGLASQHSWLTTLDLDELVCPGGQCPIVVAGRPTRPDAHHIQPFFARGHTRGVEQALAEVGVDLARARLDQPQAVAQPVDSPPQQAGDQLGEDDDQ